jgi:hypothetical protein
MKGQQPFETVVATYRAACDGGVGGYLGGVDEQAVSASALRMIDDEVVVR